MVCPSLLRKEMGDLVLAIRTAFSSAFRAKASANREQCGGESWTGLKVLTRTALLAGVLGTHRFCRSIGSDRRTRSAAGNATRETHTEVWMLSLLFSIHTKKLTLFHNPLQSQKPPLLLFKSWNLPMIVSYRVLKPHLWDKNFRAEREGREGRSNWF